jgi:arylsulfatase A-like enzyme
MLEAIEERGELGNTVIVYSSDHGEMLGDHARWGKSVFYQPSVGVPLAVSGPGFRRGAASDALVSTHDLTATFLELAGAEELPEMDSRSLVALLRGETDTHRAHVRSGLDEWRMVWDGRLKLAQTTLDSGEVQNRLFDLADDPGELRDLAGERKEVVQRLAPLLNPEVAG